uniref:Methyltransferase domain-containing protein n=1 Tax=Asterionellopsis glacialis TaxID=33640 RepID=A0A7S0KZY3_9STRA|mmetsp:Transcript_1274/g.1779  ORF Transcript_1274/g.1779 Transcript_1274/m.1779 type:complete len:368 (+) Transcript_1274:162-1265(+)
MLYNKENKKNDEEKLVPMQISTSSTHHGQSSLSNGANTTMTVALFCLGFVGISFVVGSLKSSSLISSSSHQNHHQLVPYTCSADIEASGNDNHEGMFDKYAKSSKTDVNKTLDDFRSMYQKAWSMYYPAIKEMLLPWKEVAFVPHIQSGDSIYESACGIGINLLATLEILATHDIHDLTIYGNDYVQENVNLGNYVWSTEDAKLLGHKGLFCRGDSSNLDFVPSNSFDLVFTGYIDPLQDPLNLIDDESLEEDDDAPCHYQSKEFCNSDDPVYQYVMKQEQLAEEDWFASWVTEMVRIAKPGKVISVESIAEPICKNQHDWGGVDKEWWPKAVDKYKWDVDPSSIVIRQVQYPAFRLRYNVMMKKNS